MNLQFEGTINEVKLHNSKIGDDSWVDISIRVAGQAGIQAAMLAHRAESKLVKVEFKVENGQK